uniref:coiled-coil domain-containing protein n=1 Tax=Anaerococcus mediterraneensis TaxID=1870984 RepID=UPI00093179C6|nr:hypothetical protein [Anaerococcus mediterraneensis]
MNKNRLKYGLLALALVISLPTNAKATETDSAARQLTAPPTTQENPTQTENQPAENPVENLIDLDQVDMSTVNTPTNPSASPINPLPTRPRTTMANPSPDKLTEVEDKLEIKLLDTELTADDKPAKKIFNLSHMIQIKGDGLPKEYTISVFALKSSQVKDLSLDNHIVESKVNRIEDLKDTYEKIDNDDIIGFRFKSTITYNASIKSSIKFPEDADPGDYTIYCIVSSKEAQVADVYDTHLVKNGLYEFYIDHINSLKNHNGLIEKEDPYGKGLYTRFIINKGEKPTNLTDYLDLIDNKDLGYEVLITDMNPSKEEETFVLTEPTTYKVNPNSIIKVEIGKKSEIDELLAKKKTTDNKEPISLMSMAKIQNKDDSSKDISLEERSAKLEDKKAEKLAENLEDRRLELEKRLKEAEELDKEVGYTTKLSVNTLTELIETTDKQIKELISQALLYYDLEKIEDLEKKDPKEADKEYARIKLLVKEAASTSKKAEKKLIEMDEIILTDDKNEPILGQNKDKKPVLNLAHLTQITKVNDLSKNSPNEKERDFAKRLEEKLARANKKIETVTIGEKENDKAADDKKKDEKLDASIASRYPIFINYLEGLDQRSDLLKPGRK